MANKYKPLEDHLRRIPAAVGDVSLTFRQIADILGSELPRSAREFRPWWANQRDAKNRPQAYAWRSAGFSVDSVSLGPDGWVRFRRSGPVDTPRKGLAAASRQVQRSDRQPRSIEQPVLPVQQALSRAPRPVGNGSVVFLVSCVAQKSHRPAAARDLYLSDWFRKARRYVEASGMPWFILSAEHGLLSPDTVIAPYERTLNTMGVAERHVWAQRVTGQMGDNLPPAERVVILAGQRYREFLMHYLSQRFARVEVPLEGLRIGEQLSWLARHCLDGAA